MAIQIEKRTRVDVEAAWTTWVATTDASPFNNTDLIEYRTLNDILISDLTDGTVEEIDSKYVWVGDGIFDKLIGAVNGNIAAQFDNGRIKDAEYAQVYLGSMQSVVAQSMQFLLQEKQVEAEVNELLLNGTADRLIKDKQLLKTQEEIDLLQTQDSETILNGTADRLKTQEEIDLLQTQDSETILDGVANRLIKAKQLLETQAKTDLYTRQKEGFDHDQKKALLKLLMDSWSVAYSTDPLAELLPDNINKSNLDRVTKNAMDALQMDSQELDMVYT